jgi:hypothetical protein
VPAIGVGAPAARLVGAAAPAPVAAGRVARWACVARPLAPPRLSCAGTVLAADHQPRAARLNAERRDGNQQLAQGVEAEGAHVELAAEVLLVLGRQRGRVLAGACVGERRAGKEWAWGWARGEGAGKSQMAGRGSTEGRGGGGGCRDWRRGALDACTSPSQPTGNATDWGCTRVVTDGGGWREGGRERGKSAGTE